MNGVTNIRNLRPICSLCNKSMGTRNMYDFIDQYGFHDDLEEKYHTNTESSPYFQIEMRRSSSKPLTTTRYSKFPSTSFLKSSRVLEKSYSTQSEKQKKQDLKLNHQLLLEVSRGRRAYSIVNTVTGEYHHYTAKFIYDTVDGLEGIDDWCQKKQYGIRGEPYFLIKPEQVVVKPSELRNVFSLNQL